MTATLTLRPTAEEALAAYAAQVAANRAYIQSLEGPERPGQFPGGERRGRGLANGSAADLD